MTGARSADLRFARNDKMKIPSLALLLPITVSTAATAPLPRSDWGAAPVALPLFLTIAFDVADELVFTIAADESRGAMVRQLDWPTALDAREVDHTILNHYRGLLLPRAWPQAYHPIRGDTNYPNDTSEIQSDVVEC